MRIETRRPADVPTAELEAIRTLVEDGDEVPGEMLAAGLLRAHFIFTAKDNDRIVGTTTLKSPLHGYVEKIAKASGYPDLLEFRHEIGYAYVMPEYRGRGVYHQIRSARNAVLSEPAFATVNVDNKRMLDLLDEDGWTRVGVPWPGRRGNLCLLVRRVHPKLSSPITAL